MLMTLSFSVLTVLEVCSYYGHELDIHINAKKSQIMMVRTREDRQPPNNSFYLIGTVLLA